MSRKPKAPFGMERNGMYLSKENEWNEMDLSILDWMF